MRILNDHGQAEKVLEKAFLLLWNHPRHFKDSESRFLPWFIWLVRTTAINIHRDENIDDSNILTQAKIWSDSSIHILPQFEEPDIIRSAFLKLSTEQATVLEMSFFKGLTCDEISTILEIPRSVVMSRMKTGLASFYKNVVSNSQDISQQDPEELDQIQERNDLVSFALGAYNDASIKQLKKLLLKWPEGQNELSKMKSAVLALSFLSEKNIMPSLHLEGQIISNARTSRSKEQRSLILRTHLKWYQRNTGYCLAATFAVISIIFGIFLFRGDGIPSEDQWKPVDFGDLVFGENTTNSSGLVYINSNSGQPNVVFIQNLKPATPGWTYQLWLLHSDKTISSGPKFVVSSDGLSMISIENPAQPEVIGFAVSLDRLEIKDSGFPTDGVLFTFSAQ